jgi:thymidylate kinase
LKFENVIWLGGPPGSGKTTVARWLALKHGLRHWGADKYAQSHHKRAIAESLPSALRWESLTVDERWLAPPTEMAALSLEMNDDRARVIIDDLRAQPDTAAVIAEGTPLRPSLISEVIAGPASALWVIPTPESIRRNLMVRGGTATAASTDPERAVEHRIERELLVSVQIEREAAELGLHVLRVDAAKGLEDVRRDVETYFEPVLQRLPLARTDEQRAELRRDENLALLHHLREFLEEAPQVGSPATYVCEFNCECGRSEDRERVEMTLAAYEDVVETGVRVIAPSHLSRRHGDRGHGPKSV